MERSETQAVERRVYIKASADAFLELCTVESTSRKTVQRTNILRPTFDENFSEFHDKFKKMMKFIDIAIKSAEKIRESAENPGNCENLRIIHFSE